MGGAKTYSGYGIWFGMEVISVEKGDRIYTWGTPNGRKVAIMLEGFELDHEVHRVNIGEGEKHHPDFLSIGPNNSEYFSGGEYNIAYVATYFWVVGFQWHQIDLDECENVKHWFQNVGTRDSVQVGMTLPFLN